MDNMLRSKPYDGAAKSAAEAKRLCVLANRILANEGVFDAYGHVSIRNPENFSSFFISRAISPEFVTEDDILECAIEDGAVLTRNTEHRPYGERIIHASVYKLRQDINAVAHSHHMALLPFTCCDKPFKSVFHSCAMFYDGIPVYTELDVDSGLHIATVAEADRMARAMGEKCMGVFIRNHGVVIGFENIPRLVMSSIFLMDAAEALYRTLVMGGTPRYLGYDESKNCTELLFNDIGLTRGWNYWVTKAMRAYPELGRDCGRLNG